MTKLQRMLTSLVAAIPAAYLVFELVRAMLSHSENLSGMAYATMGLTLLAALTAVLIPVGIMVGGKRKSAAAKAGATNSSASEEIETVDEVDDGVDVMDESSDAISSGSSEFEFSETSDEMLIDESDDGLSVDEFDDFDIDEEEPKPKKKKK